MPANELPCSVAKGIGLCFDRQTGKMSADILTQTGCRTIPAWGFFPKRHKYDMVDSLKHSLKQFLDVNDSLLKGQIQDIESTAFRRGDIP